ncbi:hypothetical protein MTP04_09060 [Lysinibacillus sp. PLM2]|nr:hypothetical protein MTP04_09060 [Lysinibacillus sp. PLM2]
MNGHKFVNGQNVYADGQKMVQSGQNNRVCGQNVNVGGHKTFEWTKQEGVRTKCERGWTKAGGEWT